MFTININLRFESHLGAVKVSVLGTGPEVCRLNPGQGDGFLRAIKICSIPSFRGEVNQRRHIVRFYGM
jgi:hypothetical protein